MRSVRMVFALAFSLFMAVTSWADSYPKYVTEVKVVGGTESEVDKVAKTLKKEDGWVRLDKDLNDNAGGDYIYLFYKTASRKDPKGDYITDLFIREGNDVQAFTLNGRIYHRTSYDGGSHFKSVHGNLNSGTGEKTADLWLYYTRSNFSDKRAVSSIWVNSSSSGAVSGIDLNKGAGGDDIFMHISTETKVNAPKTDPVFKSGLVYNGKERALIETDASLWSGSMIYSYHEGVIEHYRLNYNAVKATNAGTYTIEYYASATDYAAETSVHTQTVTIAKSSNNGVSVNIAFSYIQGSTIKPSLGGNLSTGSVTYEYSTSKSGSYSSTTPSKPGSYWVRAVVAGDKNCNSKTTASEQFEIIPSIAYMTIATIPAHTYTGSAICPELSIKDGSKTLVQGTDYTVSCSNNVNVGLATMTITGMGTYAGSTTRSFAISPKSVSGFTLTYDDSPIYTGSAICPTVVVTDGETELVQGTDYTVECENNVNVGEKATVGVFGIGNYTGSQYGPFAIQPKSVQNLDITYDDIEFYRGSAVCPEVVVKDGDKTLEQGTDYTVECENNVNVGEKATVGVFGMGNYTGSQYGPFTIEYATYVDENGETKKCEKCERLSSNAGISVRPSGWYVAVGSVNIAGIYFSGDVKIILADGAELKVDAGNKQNGIEVNGDIAIYGQEKQTGSLLAIGLTRGFNAKGDITINGGLVSAEGGDYGFVSQGDITINGGSVTATGYGIYSRTGNIILGWTDAANDRIKASDYWCDKDVKIADGKRFTDESGNTYFGTLTAEEISAIRGKTLTPAVMPPVAYIDENGEMQTVTGYTLLTGSENESVFKKGGWYVVSGNVTYDEEAGNRLAFDMGYKTPDVKLILADGATLTVKKTTIDGLSFNNLAVYAQSTGEKMGKFEIVSERDAFSIYNSLVVYGGTVDVTAGGFAIISSKVVVKGGAVNVASTVGISSYGVEVYGGVVDATATGIIDPFSESIAIVARSYITVHGGSVSAHTREQDSYGILTATAYLNAGTVTVDGEGDGFALEPTCSSSGVQLAGATVTANSYKIMDNSYKDLFYIGVVNDNLNYTDGEGNIYDGDIYVYNKVDKLSLIAGKTLTPVPVEPAIVFTENCDGACKSVASINGNYSAKLPVNVPDAVEVDEIDFNREFKAGVPATVVLPFTLPEGSTTNAKFYYLKDVAQDGMSWVATMKNIGSKNLPAANTPYAVIVPDGGKLQFDLKGQKASVSTNYKHTTRVADGNWLFVGVYTYKVWEEGDEEIGLAYGFAGAKSAGGAAEGEFGKLAIDYSGDTPQYPYAYPLRAYLRKRDESVRLFGNVQDAQVAEAAQAAKGRPVAPGESVVARYSAKFIPESIDVQFEDEDENGEHTTFVARLNTRTGEFKMLRNYDLKGRKLNGAPRARGAYYGKKVLNK